MKQTTAALALFSVLIMTMGCNNRPAKQKTITRDTTSHNRSRPTAADTAKGDSIAVAQIEKLPEYKGSPPGLIPPVKTVPTTLPYW